MIIRSINVGLTTEPETGKKWPRVDILTEPEKGEDIDEVFKATYAKVIEYQSIMCKQDERVIDREKSNGDEHIIAGIEKCTSAAQLRKEWYLVSKGKEVTLAAYNKKLGELLV